MINQTLYDTFNARYLSYYQIADSFVMINSHFEKLIKNNHTLLMGPRGCGKTTFLKMLTIPAIDHWDKINKEKIKEKVPFYTIYIPTDVQWKRQLQELEKGFPDNPNFSKLISNATITVNTLIALCETFSYIIEELKNKGDVSIEQIEIDFSRELIHDWKLNAKTLPSIISIESHLLEIVSEINAKTRKALFFNKPFEDFHDLVFHEFVDLVNIACTKFETFFKLSSDKRWALCFDELEIAPSWLQYKLLESLRSSRQKILFKLTTAPIVSLYKEVKENYRINASENNDYNVIRIWTSNQRELKDWRNFCAEISKKRIQKKFNNLNDLESIVGKDSLNLGIIESLKLPSSSKEEEVYTENSPSWFLFKELAKIDKSFNAFLKQKSIDPNNPIPKDNFQKDTVFRKMRQLAIYRYQFKKQDSSRRSRKIVPIYYGLPQLYELCDGNPRFLIGVVDELILNAESSNNQFNKISINQQSRIITQISERYISVLASYPGSTVVIGNKDKNIKDLLEEIGDYFHFTLTDDDFTIDPSGSFKIDSDIPAKLVDLLELALYLGALVYLDNKEAVSEKGVIDKKFRLSYMLSPYFRLLPREYVEIRLSKIIKKPLSPSGQLSILDKNDN